MRIKISPFAEIDILESIDFYECKRSGLGDEFLEEINLIIKAIVTNPQIFPAEYQDFQTALLKRFPFKVIFIIEDNICYIIAVFHHKRNPGDLNHRFDSIL